MPRPPRQRSCSIECVPRGQKAVAQAMSVAAKEAEAMVAKEAEAASVVHKESRPQRQRRQRQRLARLCQS